MALQDLSEKESLEVTGGDDNSNTASQIVTGAFLGIVTAAIGTVVGKSISSKCKPSNDIAKAQNVPNQEDDNAEEKIVDKNVNGINHSEFMRRRTLLAAALNPTKLNTPENLPLKEGAAIVNFPQASVLDIAKASLNNMSSTVPFEHQVNPKLKPLI